MKCPDDLSTIPLQEQETRTLHSRIAFLMRERKHFQDEIRIVDHEVEAILCEIDKRKS